jgi:hypothetical protein
MNDRYHGLRFARGYIPRPLRGRDVASALPGG